MQIMSDIKTYVNIGIFLKIEVCEGGLSYMLGHLLFK
jgi:hypothetical protein